MHQRGARTGAEQRQTAHIGGGIGGAGVGHEAIGAAGAVVEALPAQPELGGGGGAIDQQSAGLNRDHGVVTLGVDPEGPRLGWDQGEGTAALVALLDRGHAEAAGQRRAGQGGQIQPEILAVEAEGGGIAGAIDAAEVDVAQAAGLAEGDPQVAIRTHLQRQQRHTIDRPAATAEVAAQAEQIAAIAGEVGIELQGLAELLDPQGHQRAEGALQHRPRHAGGARGGGGGGAIEVGDDAGGLGLGLTALPIQQQAGAIRGIHADREGQRGVVAGQAEALTQLRGAGVGIGVDLEHLVGAAARAADRKCSGGVGDRGGDGGADHQAMGLAGRQQRCDVALFEHLRLASLGREALAQNRVRLHRRVAQPQVATERFGVEDLEAVEQGAGAVAADAEAASGAIAAGADPQVARGRGHPQPFAPARQVDGAEAGADHAEIERATADAIHHHRRDRKAEGPDIEGIGALAQGGGGGDAIAAVAEAQLQGLAQAEGRHPGRGEGLLPLQGEGQAAGGLAAGLEHQLLQLGGQQLYGKQSGAAAQRGGGRCRRGGAIGLAQQEAAGGAEALRQQQTDLAGREGAGGAGLHRQQALAQLQGDQVAAAVLQVVALQQADAIEADQARAGLQRGQRRQAQGSAAGACLTVSGIHHLQFQPQAGAGLQRIHEAGSVQGSRGELEAAGGRIAADLLPGAGRKGAGRGHPPLVAQLGGG